MMWAWAIGSLSVAAVGNQISIALWWRALAATEPDLYRDAVGTEPPPIRHERAGSGP
jgi:hypothetical protein